MLKTLRYCAVPYLQLVVDNPTIVCINRAAQSICSSYWMLMFVLRIAEQHVVLAALHEFK
jgi:hypothetical protein